MHAQKVLDFWFAKTHQPFWFEKNTEFDDLIRQNFGKLHEQASRSELWGWRKDINGRLAEIIVLDQFSRNLYRGEPKAFAQDAMALSLAQEAISQKLDQQLDLEQRKFLYLPFMHSESAYVHEFALKLFQNLGDDDTLEYQKRHQDIIIRFGRYPHRNEILGRISTHEELEFLKQPNSRF